MADLEEIQCTLCRQQYNTKDRVPLLLPNCGHSYCLKCIEENSIEAGLQSKSPTGVGSGADNDVRQSIKGTIGLSSIVEASNEASTPGAQ